jgi:hypothetical protein
MFSCNLHGRECAICFTPLPFILAPSTGFFKSPTLPGLTVYSGFPSIDRQGGSAGRVQMAAASASLVTETRYEVLTFALGRNLLGGLWPALC